MSIPGSLTPLFSTGSSAAGGYQIERSLRFNSADSAYLSRTPAVAGNRTTWTWAGWVKRGALDGNRQVLFGTGDSGLYNSFEVEFFGNVLRISDTGESGGNIDLQTTQVFRDCSAWGHLLVSLDTAQTTASNRVNIYWNGVKITTFSTATYPGLSTTCLFNTTAAHGIGRAGSFNSFYLNGYLADIHFIDGQALTPSSFTEVSATTGQLIPKAYAGAYTGNSFWLKFNDNSAATATTLGKDSFLLGNNWTPNNLQVSATGPIYSSTFTYSGTGSPAGVQDAPGAFLVNSPTIPDNSQSSGRNAYVNHSGGTSFIQFNPSPAISGSNVRVFTYQPQGTSGADTWINVNGGSDLRPWRVSPNYTGWSNSVAIPGGSLSSLRVSLSYGGSSTTSFWAVEVDGVVLRESLAQNIDSLVDTPTSYGTDTYVGGEVRGNYCTWNPLANLGHTLANGNLDASSTFGALAGTVGMVSGKYYWEITLNTVSGNVSPTFGYINEIFNISTSGSLYMGGESNSGVIRRDNGQYFQNNNSVSMTGSAGFIANDVAMLAFDADAKKMWIGKNGTWYNNGAPASGTGSVPLTITGNVFFPAINSFGDSWSCNFGQRAFAYTAPSGFKALCDTNLGAPLVALPNTVFNVITYTGNGGTQTLPNANSTPATPLAFSPDWVWTKARSFAENNNVFDTVRGATKLLLPDQTNSEQTISGITAFNSDGYTLGGHVSCNSNGQTYVAWAWDAGANSSKTYTVTVVGGIFYIDGKSQPTINLEEGSTYIFDQSAASNSSHPLRFSTTSNGTHGGGTEYTTGVTTAGTPGNAGAQTQIAVASGAPALYYYCTNHSGMGGAINTNTTAGASNFVGSITSQVRANVSAGFSVVTYTGSSSGSTVGHGLGVAPAFIIGKRRDGASEWSCYHQSLGNAQAIILNTTAAAGGSSTWNSTSPTSSVVSLGAAFSVNFPSYTHVLYCFAPVVGYSSMGSYVGNGSADGPFVYTGFRPRFVLVKLSSAAGNPWLIFDSARSTYNVVGNKLAPNSSVVEDDASIGNSTQNTVDFLSNGFKPRTADNGTNGSSQTYIFAAFAENPFQYARAR